MKTSLILLVTATAVPFFTLLGLSVLAAVSVITALNVVAMISLDYNKSARRGYIVKVAAPLSVTATHEDHPFAA